MKAVIPVPTLIGALLFFTFTTSSTEAKGTILRRRTKEGSGEPEVADIVNGTATGKVLPYQVCLIPALSEGLYLHCPCGGSLIASRVVLTAAHCYIDDDGKPREKMLRTVLVNMYDQTQALFGAGITTINLSPGMIGRDIIPHPNYNPTSKENDVALVILPTGLVEGENIQYAKLNKDPTVPEDDERLYVSGWGDTDAEGTYRPPPPGRSS